VLNFAHAVVAFFFSVFSNETTADGALSAKISEELVYEKEAASEGEPDFLKTFKESGIWTVCV
jgi:complement component 1 Q subcomponent-binding protein